MVLYSGGSINRESPVIACYTPLTAYNNKQTFIDHHHVKFEVYPSHTSSSGGELASVLLLLVHVPSNEGKIKFL